MKLLIVGLCCLAAVSARKIIIGTPGDPFAEFKNDHDVLIREDDPNRAPTDFRGDVMKAKIHTNENRIQGKGRFRFTVETENGISVSQGGKLKEDGKTFVTHGSFSFTGADNRRYRTRWTADERGYHPVTELEEVEIPDFEAAPTQAPVRPTPPPPPPSTAKPVQKDSDYAYKQPVNRLYLPAAVPTTTTTTTPKPLQKNNAYLPPVNRLYLPAAVPTTTTTTPAPPPQPTPPRLPPLIEIAKSYPTPNRQYVPALPSTTRIPLPPPPPPPAVIKSYETPNRLYLPAAAITTTTTTLRPPPQVPQLPALLEIKSYENPSRLYLPAKGYIPPAQNYGYY